MNFSQLLHQKSDTIMNNWVQAVYLDRNIKNKNSLSYTDVKNHIPLLLVAMTNIIFQSTEDDIKSLVGASFSHGVERAKSGFKPAEIAREYHLLRQEVLSALESDLEFATGAEIIRVVKLIDAVIDEAIAQAFVSYTQERVLEIEQLHSQLMLTNEELNRLVNATQENLSHLAHELKTPLHSIINYSDLFLRQVRKRSDLNESLPNIENIERVLRNGRQLICLINSALELSRCEAGKMQLRLVNSGVKSVINSAVEMMEPLAQAKELSIIVDCTLAPDEVITDVLRLQQIITNLLSNAIRYTESGTITLACYTLSETKWMIVIIDTGIGISEQEQSHVFEPFYRGASSACKPDSTGLGLPIVKQLVKLMQGEILLESQVGVGTTFTVVLPLEIK